MPRWLLLRVLRKLIIKNYELKFKNKKIIRLLMAKRDYYEVLGIEKNASIEDIKSSYRKLALKFHPDRNPEDKVAEESFKEATEAYEVLSDTDKRARYDRYGHEGVRMGQDFGNYSNFEDIFSHFSDIFGGGVGGSSFGGSIFDDLFGGGSSRRRGGSSRGYMGERGSDIKIRLPLTLEEIAKGVEKSIKLKLQVKCDVCNGSGAKSGSGYAKCPTCNGHGEIRQVSRSIFGQMVNISACPACNGSGQIIADHCSNCRGEGNVIGETTIKATIPAGVESGNYLPLRGKANAGRRGGEPGDLIVIIEEKEHEEFRRQQDNVIYHLTLSFPEAALGTEKTVPTLYGTEKIKIDAGSQPGTIITLREKGIPHLNSHGKGDQFVYLNIFVPTNLNSTEKNILKELSTSPNINPKKKDSQEKGKDFFEKVKEVFF
jgi:molecular chaperone DnaJ